MKKLISLVLALIMVLGLLAACDKAPVDDTKAPEQTKAPDSTKAPEQTEPPVELEPVNLRWIYDGKEREGTDDVIEAFNKKLAALLPNTTVEFVAVSDYAVNWPMMLAGDEDMDIAWIGWKTPMYQDTLDGSLTPLNELIEKYGPNIAEEQGIWTDAYDTARMDGELYALPNLWPDAPESQWMTVRDIMIPYVDMDALLAEIRGNFKCTEKVLDIVEDAYEAAIADGVLTVGSDEWYIDANNFAVQAGRWGYQYVGPEGNQVYFDPCADEVVLYHLYEIPEVKMGLARIAEWYDRGWITQNNVLNQRPENSKNTIEFSGSWNANWAAADENGTWYEDTKNTALDGQGRIRICTNRPEEGYKGTNIYGRTNSYTSIPYTSENPERAMMLLNLLRSPAGTPGNELANLLMYGFEKNSPEAAEYGWYGYELAEGDGQQYAKDYNHDEMHFMDILGNKYKTLSDGTDGTSVATKEYCLNFFTETYPNLNESPISGMTADYSELNDYLSGYKSVVNEYKTQLLYGTEGVDGWEALYEEFIEKLYAAGFAEVKAELEAQIADYVG